MLPTAAFTLPSPTPIDTSFMLPLDTFVIDFAAFSITVSSVCLFSFTALSNCSAIYATALSSFWLKSVLRQIQKHPMPFLCTETQSLYFVLLIATK